MEPVKANASPRLIAIDVFLFLRGAALTVGPRKCAPFESGVVFILLIGSFND